MTDEFTRLYSQGDAVGCGQDVPVGDERPAAEELAPVHERGHERILVLPRHPPVEDLGHKVGGGRQPVHAAQGLRVVWRWVHVVDVVVFVGEVVEGVVLEGVLEGLPVDGKVLRIVALPRFRLLLVVWAANAVDLKTRASYLRWCRGPRFLLGSFH